jgi:UDP-glucose 4-epimerase
LSGEVSRVLVTGGAGFIGSHVVDELVRSRFSVTVLDDLSAGRLENLGLHLSRGAVKFIEGDIRNQDLVEKLVADVDAVVHLAALVSVPLSVKDPDSTFDVNVNGTSNVLVSCSNSGVKKVIFASSSAVYGDAQYLPVDEGHPTCPLSPYASSKLEGEHVCEEFVDGSDAEVVVLRFFNVYGPRQSSGEYGGVITKFLDLAKNGEALVVYGDGSQIRDFIYVSDVAQTILTLLRKDRVEGVFNIGCGEAVTIGGLAEQVLKVVGKDVGVVHEPPREGDIKQSVADVFKAQRAFGFSPKVSLEDGLRSLLREREVSLF